MISSITLQNLRGIAAGTVAPLAPMTILIGPNGCGKSTVLDALLISAGMDGEAIGQAVARHPMTRNGAHWLVGPASRTAEILLDGVEPQRHYRCVIERRRPERSRGALTEGLPAPPTAAIRCTWAGDNTDRRLGFTSFTPENHYVNVGSPGRAQGLPFGEVRLVDPGLPIALNNAYSEAVRQGRKREVMALLQALVADVDNVEILTEDDGTPTLYITRGTSSLPVGLAGDGVQSFLQLALALAAQPDGLALVEDPEVYLQARAVQQTAKALLATMRRNMQVVVTTHSLELVEDMVEQMEPSELGRIALFSLRLEGGELASRRYAGPDIAGARAEVERDLR
jgi:energy-coupling factor transporter ATP-binding protein EcfA2